MTLDFRRSKRFAIWLKNFVFILFFTGAVLHGEIFTGRSFSIYAQTPEAADEIEFDDDGSTRRPEVETPNFELVPLKSAPHGLLARLNGVRDVLVLDGSPAEMGKAHGILLGDRIEVLKERLYAAGRIASMKEKTDFFAATDEAISRTREYVPERFYEEMDALAEGACLDVVDARRLNHFPELFHCSGVALRGAATVNGQILHVRVLDYMRDIGLQDASTIIVYIPDKLNAWISVSYAGFVGSVTAMNEKGLAIGEMGGAGEGKWDGLPMAFLIRRIMEECATVDEAVELMKSTPLTCDYYYVLSDATGDMVAIEAIAGSESPVTTLRPGEETERLPGALDDVVYVSAGDRAVNLYERLKSHYGAIDVKTLQEIVKAPVAMKSNLHDVIFAPETLELWHAEAGSLTPAYSEPYRHVKFADILKYYSTWKK